MKLRQKLAVVLASAMVVTAVPVVTMAASSSSSSKVVVTANTTTALGNTAPEITVEMKHDLTSNEFYISLEGAEWAKTDSTFNTTDVTTSGSVEVVGTITPSSKTEAVVRLNSDAEVKAGDKLQFLLENAIVKADEAFVVIDGDGTEVTSEKILFATKNTANATVKAESGNSFYVTKGSDLGAITIEETVSGKFANTQVFTVDLENSDYEFLTGSAAKSAITVTGTRAFSSETVAFNVVELTEDSLVVEVAGITAANKGGFKIDGLQVKSVEKEPVAGDLNVTVSGEAKESGKTTVDTTTVAVAKVAEYGTTFTVSEKKDVVSGKEVEVKATLKEVTKDSISNGAVEFSLDKGVLKVLPTIKGVAADDITPVYKDKKDPSKGMTGFIVDFGGTSDTDKLEMTLKVVTDVATEGDITLTAEGRFVEETSVVLATAAKNFSVKSEAMTLKVGQSKQVGGKLVVAETEAGAFKRGTTIEITVDKEDGITLTDLPEVTATNGMTVKADWKEESATTTSATIVVEVTKASKDASAEIVIEGFEVKVDRTVPEGAYNLTLAIEGLEGEVEEENFLVVGTPNTEDLASNGLAKGTSKFVIGESKYTVNGVEKEMDAQSFIQDPGFTMVPMRYVAEAFGVEANNILFSKGVTTIFAGNRTIQLTNGSDVAIVNGVQIKMATKVVIKEGRTYAPIGEVAQLLGIQKDWDNASKTAVFINK